MFVTSNASVTSQVCHFTSKWTKMYYFVQSLPHWLHSRKKKVRNSIILKKASLRHCATKLLSTLTVFDVKICKKRLWKNNIITWPPLPPFQCWCIIFCLKTSLLFYISTLKMGEGLNSMLCHQSHRQKKAAVFCQMVPS